LFITSQVSQWFLKGVGAILKEAPIWGVHFSLVRNAGGQVLWHSNASLTGSIFSSSLCLASVCVCYGWELNLN